MAQAMSKGDTVSDRDLKDQIRQLASDLDAAGEWVWKSLGYPLDMISDRRPPPGLFRAIIDAAHKDPSCHGGNLTKREVESWFRQEIRFGLERMKKDKP
ncbi:MAG: hypothetical protein RIB60_06165 [Phycisphaerales bacterium]